MPKILASGWILMSLLLLLPKPLSKSEGRGLLLMMAKELLVLRLRSLGKTSLKHQPLTTHLLLFLRGKEEKENILSSKMQLQKLML